MRVDASNRWPGTVNRGERFPGVVNAPSGAAPALPPSVSVPDGGNKLSTTASVNASGTILITNTDSVLNGELGTIHFLVKAENMKGKTLVVRRSGSDPNGTTGGDVTQWQASYAYSPDGPWYEFDTVEMVSGVMTATKTAPLTEATVYVARRPVFTLAMWDAAIARWRANPLTAPTASGNALFEVGTLPAVTHAPAMKLRAFKFGTGPAAVVLTGTIHVDEHIAAFSMEALVDWLLSADPDAAYLRGKCTFYVYPNMNPQARYAGASRVEIETYGNANRIWETTGYDNINLSKMWRDVWEVDLPKPIAGNIDFHDATGGKGGAMTYDHVATSSVIMGHVMAENFARTGVLLDRNPGGTSSGVQGGIARYILDRFGNGANWMITAEHLLSKVFGVPEWQAWGRDLGRGMRDLYDTDGTGKWKVPPWETATAGAITEDKGEYTITTASGNPAMAFAFPAGKALEMVVSITPTTNNLFSLRQSETSALALATSTILFQRTTGTSTAMVLRTQAVPVEAGKTWLGAIIAAQTFPAKITAHAMTRYRVLP